MSFSEDHRGGILVFNPRTLTTTIRHTYQALGLVEEPRLDDIIYVIASDSPVTLTPAPTEHTVYCSAHDTFADSFRYRRAYYLRCWCRDLSG